MNDVERLIWITSKASAYDYCANWDFTVKQRPSDELLTEKIAALRIGWTNLAGPGLCDNSVPIKFTGRKKRRLIVEADFSYRPLWGEYSRVCEGKAPHKPFAEFRRRVNAMLAPHAVDHIDFVERGMKSGVKH